MNVLAEDIQAHWSVVGPLFSIRNEHEYDLAIERLNALIDEVGTDEEHPLYELLDTLGAAIQLMKKNTIRYRDGDLLVEFEDANLKPSKRFFGLLHHPEDALGCEVDLLTVSGLRNPYSPRRVLEERISIYEG